jgi:hypothetical protein
MGLDEGRKPEAELVWASPELDLVVEASQPGGTHLTLPRITGAGMLRCGQILWGRHRRAEDLCVGKWEKMSRKIKRSRNC